jgi:hypothetical protein
VLSEGLGSGDESPALAEVDWTILFSGVIAQPPSRTRSLPLHVFSNVLEHLIEGGDMDQHHGGKLDAENEVHANRQYIRESNEEPTARLGSANHS